jgi:hypothetical protein
MTAVSRDAILKTDTVKDALYTKANDDMTELFAIALEVETARGGEDDLDARLDGVDDSIAALTVGTGCPVSANDTTPGYLNGKLLGNTDILLTEGDDGGDETLTISLKSTGQIATLTTSISNLETNMTKLVMDAENLAFFGSIAF